MTTTPISVTVLLSLQTQPEIFSTFLEAGEVVGLPVSSWRVGDPTRTQFYAASEALAQLEQVQLELAKAAFLLDAEGDWLSLRGNDVYGVPRDEPQPATSTVTVDNAGGGVYEVGPGGVIFSNSTTGATFQNQETVSIPALTSGIAISVVAQEAGAIGSSIVDEIDTIVSPTLTGVTIVGSTAAVGVDAQSDPGYRDQCLATLGALSPNGPADALESVARNTELTGIAGVTRAFASGDNTTGTANLYVGTATTGLDGASVAAIQDAVDLWATPLCSDSIVASMTPVSVDLTIDLTPDTSDLEDAIVAKLGQYYADWRHDTRGGIVARSAIEGLVFETARDTGVTLHNAVVTSPASDPTFAEAEFPINGTVTVT